MMRELTAVEFEDEIARGCKDRLDELAYAAHLDRGGDSVASGLCGNGFCHAGPDIACPPIARVREWLQTPGVVGVVLFRNQDAWATEYGEASCLVVGPGKTYETIESCEGKWLNDQPSQRRYATCFVRSQQGVFDEGAR